MRVEVHSAGARQAELLVQLLDLGEVVGAQVEEVRLVAGHNEVDVRVEVPPKNARGYQVRVALAERASAPELAAATAQDGAAPAVMDQPHRLGASVSTALLAATHWRHVPRYGFLSDFVPGPGGAVDEGRVRELAKFHITIVQFYDWMFRHYQFVPPRGEDGNLPESFIDAMGREVSLAAVTQRVRQCKASGMAPIAYGAVYGPEPEFILERPDWLLYDSAGKPLHLIELFYITDLRPGGWREHILREFEAAVTEVGFSGIHMDQYGFPKLAYDAFGALVDPSAEFPSMIDEAAGRLQALQPDAGVIFNAVNDWPIDTVASSAQEAVYIEVWSPHDRYRDLVQLVRRARDLSGKQAILSAYLLPFHEGGPGAEWALRYVTAVIASAGGHHLVLGEGSGVLREPYYPDHGRLSEEGVGVARRYYDHSAAYTHYLHAPELRPVSRNFATGINTAFRLEGAAATAEPSAGNVWLSVAQREGQFVLNLVNLTGVQDDAWNVAQPAAQVLSGLALLCEPFIRVKRVTWASPDGLAPASDAPADVFALELTATLEDGAVRVKLPQLCVWATLVVEFE